MTKTSVCILAMLVIVSYLSAAIGVQAMPASLLLSTGDTYILLARAQPKQQRPEPKKHCQNVHSGVSFKSVQLCRYN
jgi:hypothetical protein